MFTCNYLFLSRHVQHAARRLSFPLRFSDAAPHGRRYLSVALNYVKLLGAPLSTSAAWTCALCCTVYTPVR